MIQGKYRRLFLYINAGWVPVGCLTSNGFSEDAEVFETTVRDNGGYRSVVPLSMSYSVTFDGLVKNSIGDPTVISLDRLRTLMRSKTIVPWKLETNDSSMLDFGYGYLTGLSDSASVGEFVTFSGTIIGTGQVYNIENDTQSSVPNAPFISFGTIDSSFLTVVWDVPESAFPIQSFRIYRNDTFLRSQTYSGSGLPQSFLDNGITADSTYSYNVTAVDINGAESALSNKIISGPLTGGNEIPDAGYDFICLESYPGGLVKFYLIWQEDQSLIQFEF